MRNNQFQIDSSKHGDSFMEKPVLQNTSLVTGLFSLIYDGQWRCSFASEPCFQILKCSPSDFLKTLRNLTVFTEASVPTKTVGMLLDEIHPKQETYPFTSIRFSENEESQYIRGTLAADYSQKGKLTVFGQITNLSGEQASDIQMQDLYEWKISHLRFQQTLESESRQQLSYIEADLTDDLVENYTFSNLWSTASSKTKSYSQFMKDYYFGLVEQDCVNAHAFYSRESLLSQYSQGVKHLENLWRSKKNMENLWIMIKADLVEDPISGHIKLYARMLDMTAEQEALIEIHQRADFDMMTGLLRKDAGEAHIKQYLAQKRSIGGILILLDLDDLKRINDHFGHEQGDAAIINLSNTLKGHFRKDDIIVRAGGDEFLVFLPEAGDSEASIRYSMELFMRKLTHIFIGENQFMPLRCSVGCAVEKLGTDNYESLFKRADIALYHVKRHDKNNYAFFSPEMMEEDHRFKEMQTAPHETIEGEDLLHLLEIVAPHHPGVLLFNLSENSFRLLSRDENVKSAASNDTIDEFWEKCKKDIHPDDWEKTRESLSRDGLLAAYSHGRIRMQHIYRHLKNDDYAETEVSVDFYKNISREICAFLFFRKKD